MTTKCVSCGNLFTEEKKKKSVKVTLSNPGDVFCEGDISTCPHCGEEYVSEGDMIKLAQSFEKAHTEKYRKKITA